MKKRVVWFLFVVAFSVFTAAGCREKEKAAPKESGSVSGESIQKQDTPPAATGGAVSENESPLVQKSKKYAEQMVSGLFAPVWEDFSKDLANQLPEESLKGSFQSVLSGLTGYQGIHRIEEGESDGYQMVIVVLAYGENQGRSIRFVYDSEGHIAGIWFDAAVLDKKETSDTNRSSQTDNYLKKEITVGREPYELKGTLLIPEQAKKAPVVILFGSDDWDMDGTIGTAGNTPLKDVAEGLAKQGIATLRYHTRKYEYADKLTDALGIYDSFLQDASYAVDQMYNEREIDTGHIYLAAMGENASRMSALVKRKKNRLSGVILMGAKPLKMQESFYASPDKKVEIDAAYFMEENSTIPLLVMQGKADFETTTEDYEQWKEIWKGRSHVTYREYEYLNHYFMTTTGKSDATDYNAKNSVSSQVISEIAKWCQK